MHVTGFEPVHEPDWHVSVAVHAFPSLHDEPFALFGFVQIPVDVLQTPATWHWSDAVHVTGFVPRHVPAWHASVCVHALPSSHVAPSGLEELLHRPVSGSQVPLSWHWSPAQVIALAPTHAPA